MKLQYYLFAFTFALLGTTQLWAQCTFATVEAESAQWKQDAVSVQATTDISGSEQITNFAKDQWLAFAQPLKACTYLVSYRVASANGGGKIRIEKAGGAGPYYATLDVPATGGENVWQTITHTITIPDDIPEVAIVNTGDGIYNLNWFHVGAKDAVPTTLVEVTPASKVMQVGETLQATAKTTLLYGATNQNVTWSSTHPAVATVTQNGLITAVSNGSATIKVTTELGENTAQISIQVKDPDQLELLWADEFDGSSLNTDNWVYEIGDGCQYGNDLCGYGNQELQYYSERPENVRLENGKLILTARREVLGTKQFSSGKIMTRDKVNVQYGMVEASIKLPNMDDGLWPAFWMLGANNRWPYTGEIDIMEAGGKALQRDANEEAKSNIFWRAEDAGSNANLQFGNQDAYSFYAGKETGKQLHETYFVYRLYWTPDYIRTSVLQTDENHEPIASTEKILLQIDNAPTFENEFFSEDNFYLILNLAVGGWFPFDVNAGENLATNVTALPENGSEAQMLVEYVRVYALNGIGKINLGKTYGKAIGNANFGIYEDDTQTDFSLRYGIDAEILTWSGGQVNLQKTTSGFGNEALQANFQANQWSGIGLNSSDVLNLENYQNGFLRFRMQTSSAEPFQIWSETLAAGASKPIIFGRGEEKHGLKRDGKWHEITIPLADLLTDYKTVTMPFIIGHVENDAPRTSFSFGIDEVFYSLEKGEEPKDDNQGGVTAIEDQIAKEFRLYPNPTSGRIYVDLELKKSQNVILRLTDILGKEIATKRISNAPQRLKEYFDIQEVTSGIYFLHIQTEHGNSIRKIIKK